MISSRNEDWRQGMPPLLTRHSSRLLYDYKPVYSNATNMVTNRKLSIR